MKLTRMCAGLALATMLSSVACTSGYAGWRSDVTVAQKNGTPLVKAIHDFEAEKRRPPKSLSELLPKFLPSIPSPGPAAKGGWVYLTGQTNAHTVWGRPGAAGTWALGIAIRSDKSPNRWSFGDFFVYHQSRDYPQQAYGGVLERFGEWGYYHE